MTQRKIVKTVLDGGKPPYVPWHFGFSREAGEKLSDHYGTQDWEPAVGNHLVRMGSVLGFFTDEGDDCVRDHFGVVWDRSIDTTFGYIREPLNFMDDWEQQHGLLMGPALWHEFIYPVLKRIYRFVHEAGKYVVIHSCGDISMLFDDLIGIGVDCFNPLQPEVMDAHALMKKYRGRLSYYGGLSTQRTLPFCSADDVRRETQQLLDLGSNGNYICAPSQSIEGDVPLENILALMDTVHKQNNYNVL